MKHFWACCWGWKKQKHELLLNSSLVKKEKKRRKKHLWYVSCLSRSDFDFSTYYLFHTLFAWNRSSAALNLCSLDQVTQLTKEAERSKAQAESASCVWKIFLWGFYYAAFLSQSHPLPGGYSNWDCDQMKLQVSFLMLMQPSVFSVTSACCFNLTWLVWVWFGENIST